MARNVVERTPRASGTEDPEPRHATSDARELATWLASQLSDLLGLSPTEIDTSLPFAHYGLDSVHAVRLTATLAERVGQELSPTLPYEYPTIDALCAYLTEGITEERRRSTRPMRGR